MNKQLLTRLTSLLTCSAMVLSLFTGILFPGEARAQRLPSVAGNSRERKFAPDLEGKLNRQRGQQNSMKMTVILELNQTSTGEPLDQKIRKLNGQVKKVYGSLPLVSVELPVSRIAELDWDNDISYVSEDQPLEASGFLEDPTGAEQVRKMVSGSGLIGTGIGIAILDSGIDTTHNVIKAGTNHPGVVFSKDFTGQGTTADNYGHGTHVATMHPRRHPCPT